MQRDSGTQEFRVSGIEETRVSGNQEFSIPAFRDWTIRKSGIPKFRTKHHYNLRKDKSRRLKSLVINVNMWRKMASL